MADIHHAEGTDQRERHSHAGNDGGPHVAQKCEHHKYNQHDGDDQRDLDIVYGRANGDSAINDGVQMQRRRDGSAKPGEFRVDTIHGLDHVGAGLAEDGQNYAGLAAGKPEIAGIFDGVQHFGDILQAQ